jgi:hypothetical protein
MMPRILKFGKRTILKGPGTKEDGFPHTFGEKREVTLKK